MNRIATVVSLALFIATGCAPTRCSSEGTSASKEKLRFAEFSARDESLAEFKRFAGHANWPLAVRANAFSAARLVQIRGEKLVPSTIVMAASLVNGWAFHVAAVEANSRRCGVVIAFIGADGDLILYVQRVSSEYNEILVQDGMRLKLLNSSQETIEKRGEYLWPGVKLFERNATEVDSMGTVLSVPMPSVAALIYGDGTVSNFVQVREVTLDGEPFGDPE